MIQCSYCGATYYYRKGSQLCPRCGRVLEPVRIQSIMRDRVSEALLPLEDERRRLRDIERLAD